eukprot:1634173-Alexandrium_andersonii.AAC.1
MGTTGGADSQLRLWRRRLSGAPATCSSGTTPTSSTGPPTSRLRAGPCRSGCGVALQVAARPRLGARAVG